MNFDLAKKETIADLVRVYRESVADIRDAYATLAAVESRLTKAFKRAEYLPIRVRTSDHTHPHVRYDCPDDAILLLRRDVWSTLIDRLEVQRFLSVAAWEALQKGLQDDELPEITVENVCGVLQGYLDAAPDLLQESVREVFDWLRPRNGRYKTNSKHEIKKRVILQNRVELDFAGRYDINYHYLQDIVALENVFSALNGSGQINQAHTSLLRIAIRNSGKEGVGETDFFRFRCYRNGNLHVEFLRLELLREFNEIAGGKNLKP